MEEIDAMTLGVLMDVVGLHGSADLIVGDAVQGSIVLFVDVGLIRCAVGNRKTLAIDIPGTLALIGGSGSTPKEVFGEHGRLG